jgi:alkylation response protein AidB-like acyl-CoA dehydrogenase
VTQVPENVTEFREQVAEFLSGRAAHLDGWQYFRDRSGITADLYRQLGSMGWLSVSWPLADGGLGRSADFEFALWDEMAYARAAKPPIAAGLIARSIIENGTKAQKEFFLPGIAKGTLAFALGYSEPEAGSDLSSLRTTAQPDGDVYIVQGEKRWTSDAHHADYLWLLCRTGSRTSRAQGLTLLIADLASPQIEITPIETLDGHRVNEVRLDDVAIPIENRIGEEGGAWTIIQEALARERHLQVLPGRLRRDLEQLIEWAFASEALTSDATQRVIAEMAASVEAITATADEIVRLVIDGQDTLVISACQKLVGTDLMQQIARFPSSVGDQAQVIVGNPFEFMWRESILETIAGGTSEVMSSIVARRGLGLGS